MVLGPIKMLSSGYVDGRSHMQPSTEKSPELLNLAASLSLARQEQGFSQTELAARCGLSQAQISYLEVGLRQPTLDQLLRIARALGTSVQKLLTGANRPGTDLKDLALELRSLGLVDLWIKSPIVPGAFRCPEETLSLAVSGSEPDPRILEAIPAVLAWNELAPVLLRAYGLLTRPHTTRRLAWLADVALAIDRRGGFPGGCRRDQLARFIKMISHPDRKPPRWDSLGRPMAKTPASPIWKRWKICHDSDLDAFQQRANHLHESRTKTPEPARGIRFRGVQLRP
jgi:transcriptional regulator with XRE-family HTH domain